ncbi:cellulose synthase-like protein G3 [Rutidosis leptorrhynchoides]|uniref:cellulose synthase-like protein G3 n=1 Tax=Rutidosis leptorrhynchoides TaxID=125765 RepID=UPI003A998E2B
MSTTNPTSPSTAAILNTTHLLRRTTLNRIFAVIYAAGILTLFHHHLQTLRHSTTFTTTVFLIADIILTFMWTTTTSFRLYPTDRKVFPENLETVLPKKDFPALDIFICTADPYKEPPMNVVNTALSLMAYDYPPEKISVYVSDDGGSELTLFAFFEAAKFAKLWLPFCRDNNIVERCPEALFRSNGITYSDSAKIKAMYEKMKIKVESVVDRGSISAEYITNEDERIAFDKWDKTFTRHDHPAVIQVLLESGQEKDINGHPMPNLIYVSREKNKTSPHNFKAGALNTLLRVSAVTTNAPIVLTQDCDMYSNDPMTAQRMLCFYADQSIRHNLGYIQFPQRFHGINSADIYASEYKRLYVINPGGMDGLKGPCYVGSGCFFVRRVFFGGPSSPEFPEARQLCPDHVVEKPIRDQQVLDLAHEVAGSSYEKNSAWGNTMGFRYGSLSEDFFTGLHQHCRGWKSLFFHPMRPAFLGDLPISLFDALNQNRRWCIGLLEVVFSNYNPLTFGSRFMGPLMGLAYAHNAFWPIWSIPIIIYSFIPQLALLNGTSIFPKVTSSWFYLYVFLFFGANVQDCLDYMLARGTFQQWWNDQRMWFIRGLSSYLFGFIEFSIKHLGIASKGFHVTSKVVDSEQSKRYDNGVFEFGVSSPMFVPLATVAIVNSVAFSSGILQILMGRNMDGLFGQMFLACFGVINSWPIYEAMIWRSDKGRIPRVISVISTLFAFTLCMLVLLVPNA